MAEPHDPAATPDPVYAPEEVRPPDKAANSFGGTLDGADLPVAPDEPNRGSAHDDAGWRAIDPAKP